MGQMPGPSYPFEWPAPPPQRPSQRPPQRGWGGFVWVALALLALGVLVAVVVGLGVAP